VASAVAGVAGVEAVVTAAPWKARQASIGVGVRMRQSLGGHVIHVASQVYVVEPNPGSALR
jgi:hypothetical protein